MLCLFDKPSKTSSEDKSLHMRVNHRWSYSIEAKGHGFWNQAVQTT